MGCEVVWTAHAARDVDEIVAYIAQALASPQAAADQLDAFDEALQRIEAFPELYKISSLPSCAARGIRVCLAKRYAMLCSYDGKSKRATIHRVVSTLRDYGALVARS